MILIGIDPGINNTGWSVVKKNGANLKYIASGVIKTKVSEPLSSRLALISKQLQKIIDLYNPNISGLEEIFVNKNPMSSMKLAHARGAILSILGINNIDVLEFAPRTIKKNITGTGTADKDQIIHMVKIIFAKQDIKSPDEADALAVAYSVSLFN